MKNTVNNVAGDIVTTPGDDNNEVLFDLSLVEEMDDMEYVSEILTIFLGNTPKELNDLKTSCANCQYEVVHKLTHKMRGSAGLLYAIPFSKILLKIEELAKAYQNDGLVKLVEIANQEYKKIETPLKEHLRNLENILQQR